MYSFQKEYDLKAHSPLIHFQYDSNGATLRATEVKPKLDRYIIGKKGKDNIPDRWKRDDVNGKISLDYKLRIIATESKPAVDVGRGTLYDIYYGNMGDGAQIKKGVMNNAKLTVTCFHEDLLGYIDKIIGDFFIVTNFGTMQSKGFGSFTVDRKECTQEKICEVLKNEYAKTGYCYFFIPNVDEELTFKQIKMVYSLIKSGHNLTTVTKKIRNETKVFTYPQTKVVNGKDYSELYYHRSLLYQYVRIMQVNGKSANMGNEKAWMKQNGIVPLLGKSKKQNDTYSRYVRALLGIGENIRYKNKESLKAVTVKIEEKPQGQTDVEKKANKIERLNSPILFKVIDNVVYFVGCELNEKIYGKKFSFSSSMKNGLTRYVPKKNELPCNFMDGFMDYCFQELNGYFDEIREYFTALKNNLPQKYENLKEYEISFKSTANITIIKGE